MRRNQETAGGGGRTTPERAITVLAVCLVWLGLLVQPPVVWADGPVVGTVQFSRGAVTARAGDGALRVLGKGAPLYEKDVLTTGKSGSAVIGLNDGSKITVRPNTILALAEFAHGGDKESAVIRLFKGGIRALTGLIAKRKPDSGFRVQTATAVVGVRGTDFEARICEGDDCLKKEDSQPAGPGPDQPPVVGRIVRLKGSLTAQSAEGADRTVTDGGPVYQGDVLETETGGFAVLVFRDNSRVTLQSATRFKVENYTDDEGEKGGVFFRLFKGGLRVLTGLMAKRNPEAYKIGTPTAVVGVRGTLLDILTTAGMTVEMLRALNIDPAQLDQAGGVFMVVRQGIGTLTGLWGTSAYTAGKTVFFKTGMNEPSLVPAGLRFKWIGPLPEDIDDDWVKRLFGGKDTGKLESGTLVVAVFKGEVGVKTDGGLLVLGQGETGFLNPFMDVADRLSQTPWNDPTISPEQVDQLLKKTEAEVEKAMGLTDGGESCECEIVY